MDARIADPGVEETLLKFPAFFSVCPPVSLSRFRSAVHTGTGRQGRWGLEKSPLSDAGAPGKVSTELPDGEILIGGKIAPVCPCPGRVILVVLHKFALPVKVPAFLSKRFVFALVPLQHLADFFRNSQINRGKPRSRGRQRRVLTDNHGLCGRRFQHNGAAALFAGADRPVKEPEDDVRFRTGCQIQRRSICPHPYGRGATDRAFGFPIESAGRI